MSEEVGAYVFHEEGVVPITEELFRVSNNENLFNKANSIDMSRKISIRSS